MDVSLLKNAVHEQNLPIDLRVSNKGYVIGPGSVIDGNRYELVDLPAGVVPEASGAVMRMLKDFGYAIETKQKAPSLSLDDVMADRAGRVQFAGDAGYDAGCRKASATAHCTPGRTDDTRIIPKTNTRFMMICCGVVGIVAWRMLSWTRSGNQSKEASDKEECDGDERD